jgi:thiamine-phosphate pyrophosphorylase
VTHVGAIAQRARAAAPRLMVFTDTTVAPEGVLEERLERLLAAAAHHQVVVVLRDKELPVRRRLALGERLRKLVQSTGQVLAVADRIDLAVLLDAEGVHLGESSVDARDARAALPAGAWTSRACHDPARIDPDADALVLSPVAAPRKGRPALGTVALEALRRRLDELPHGPPQLLYALGGVDERNAAELLSRGATGVGVIGAALDGRNPGPLLDALGILKS